MFTFSKDLSLKEYNTFGISVNAKYYLSIQSCGDLINFFSLYPHFQQERLLVLGGGSNLLFLEDFNGLIIKPEIKGIQILSETEDTVEIEAGAGEVWDDLVSYCVQRGWGGIENLSLIPGNVGAVPVQNIGAYGVEAEASILRVNTINLQNFSNRILLNPDCKFGYRYSIFKNELKNLFLITSVVFILRKKPLLNISYGALKTEILKSEDLTLKSIRQAVISIRESKLPDPKKIGNAGSFFKNPHVDLKSYQSLQNLYPDVPFFPCENNLYKISAGWLIEKAGWKGKSYKNAAVHDKQALVLVNKGNATGQEIFELAELIKNDIYSRFEIQLEPEVNIID